MVTLSPINLDIQDTMRQKMEMLKKMTGAGSSYMIGTPLSKQEGEPQKNYMMARTPFLRMTSFTPKGVGNKTDKSDKEAVVLMGGHLGGGTEEYPMNRLKAGFSNNNVNIGSTITGNEEDPYINWSGMYLPPNNSIVDDIPYRPMAGVKDISIEYQGGGMRLGATRTGNINWTCWNWNELENFRPHFLHHGKTVLLEWGWSADGINFTKGSPFYDIFTGNTINIDENKIMNLNQNLLEHVQDQKGHCDAMLGLIQDFSWTVNEDGGFDCTTKLISQGVTLFQKAQKRNKTSTVAVLPLFANESASDYGFLPGVEDTEITFKINSSVADYAPYISIKEYMADFPSQIYKWLRSIKEGQNHLRVHHMKVFEIRKHANDQFFGEFDDAAHQGITRTEDGQAVIGSDARRTKGFVTWGWFEDNVLSRFYASIAHPKPEGETLIGEFRSILPVLDDNGKLYKRTEDDKKNGRYVDAEVGGQVYESTKFTNSGFLMTSDSERWLIPNPNDPFMASDFKLYDIHTKEGAVHPTGKNVSNESDLQILKDNLLTNEELYGEGARLRNVYFNAKYLSDKFKDSGDIIESVMSVWEDFSNEYGGIYKFKVHVSDDGKRAMVVEEGYTYKAVSETLGSENRDTELFEFPTFRSDSIVKSQNISAKVPKRMQLAAMYGQVTRDGTKKTEGTEKVTNEYDDLIAKAWGRFVEDLPSNKDGLSEAQVKQKRYEDMIHGNIDFVHRSNRYFGHTYASENSSLVLGGINDKDAAVVPGEGNSGIQIQDTILNEVQNQQLDEMYRLMKEALNLKEGENMQDAAYDKEAARALRIHKRSLTVFEELNTLDITSRSAQWTVAGTGRTWDLFYDDHHKDAGYPKLKAWAKLHMQLLLRGHKDGVLNNLDPLIPIDFEIEIDGIGGIHPGNSFHSSYLPSRYKEESLFQAVGVSHKIDSSGWFTTIKGQIRAISSNSYPSNPDKEAEKAKKQLLEDKAKENENKIKISNAKKKKLMEGKGKSFKNIKYTSGTPNFSGQVKIEKLEAFEASGGLVKHIEVYGIPSNDEILRQAGMKDAKTIQDWMMASGLIDENGNPWEGYTGAGGDLNFPPGWLDTYHANVSYNDFGVVLGAWNNWTDPTAGPSWINAPSMGSANRLFKAAGGQSGESFEWNGNMYAAW